MLPIFPKFKKVDVNDKHLIEQLTLRFPPYSDHLLSSMWSWDIENELEITLLNGNLVIRMKDYLTSEIFFSFIGNQSVDNTAKTLLKFAKEKNLTQELRLIPEHNLFRDFGFLKNNFNIVEDRDNFDYILNIEDIYHLKGSKFFNKKNKLNGFLKRFNAAIKLEDPLQAMTRKKVIECINTWVSNKKKAGKSSGVNQRELYAIQKMLSGTNYFNLQFLSVYIGGQLRAFAIYELIDKKYASLAFAKADSSFKGIYEFLNHQIASHLKQAGYLYLNVQQDLGVAGIRNAKLDYNPTFLKKFIIKRKSL